MEERKQQREQQKCNIIIDNRQHIKVSGVLDIDTFDEASFIAITTEGALVVKGDDLHISKLNVDTGELCVDGLIDSCLFNNSYAGKSGGSFISRLFK